MSEKYKNTATIFEGYEPEVEDSFIDSSWEKIKYFLPEEKRRVGGFFFLKTGVLKLFPGVLIVTSLVTTLISVKKINVIPLNINSKHVSSEGRSGIVTFESGRPIDKKENRSNKTNYKTTVVNSRAEDGLNLTSKKTPLIPVTGSSMENVSLANNQNPGSESFSMENNYEKSATNKTEVIEQVEEMPNTTDSIELMEKIPIPEMSAGIKKQDSINPGEIIAVKMNVLEKNKIIIELFTGPNHVSSFFNYGPEQMNNDQLNLSLGIGIIYQFKNKWNLNSHLVYHNNNFSFNEENTEKKIVSKQFGPSSSVGPVVVDTTYRYVTIRNRHSFVSGNNFYVNIGAGNEILRQNKLSVDAFLQLSYRFHKLKTHIERLEDSDTLQYIRGTNGPPLTNVSTENSRFSEQGEDRINSIGVQPGLTFCYKLYRNVSFIFKTAYYKQLPLRNDVSKQYNYRQDAIFLNAGVRISY
jgi:hypothetical protein